MCSVMAIAPDVKSDFPAFEPDAELFLTPPEKEEDIFLDINESFDSGDDHEVIPIEKLDSFLFSTGRSDAVKGNLTCPDILSGTVNMAPDADSNLICYNCYAFCMMELVLIQYLKIKNKQGKLKQEEVNKGVRHLRTIRAMLPALIDACAASFWAFKEGGLRDLLNEMQKKTQQDSIQVTPFD